MLDKFIPGLDGVVPPLAGMSGTRRIRYLPLETVGECHWAAAYLGLGYFFSHDLGRAVSYVGEAGKFLMGVLLAVLVFFTARKLARCRRWRGTFRVLCLTQIDPT